MRNPTNSRLDLVATCRLSPCLPVAHSAREDAERGSIFHRFLQRVVELQRPGVGLEEARAEALDESPAAHRAALASIRSETLSLDPTKIAVEVAFAYDVRTGAARELGRGINRRYDDLTPSEYAGTIDRAALSGPRRGYVGDYKTGGWSAKRASESFQLKKCALDVARAWDLDAVDAEIVRIDDDGEAWHDRATFEAFDLDLFAAELEQLDARMSSDREAFSRGEPPEATLGSHCRFCPGLPYCPAKMSIARSVLGGDNEEIRRIAGKEVLITTESAPRIWELAEQAEKILETVNQALRDFARSTPFVLSDGRTIGPVPWPTREVTDGARAVERIKELLGEPAARAAAKTKVTMEGITSAVRAWLKEHPEENLRGVVSKTEDRVFEDLLARGLARKIDAVQVRAQKPKKPARGSRQED